jgi:hypothetical protein
MQAARRDRNRRLAAKLQTMGINITIEEIEHAGKSMAGRPHFARLMVQKGYVPNTREAFRQYLDESAPGYVDREEPTLAEGIERIQAAGGVSSVAHTRAPRKARPRRGRGVDRQLRGPGPGLHRGVPLGPRVRAMSSATSVCEKYGIGVTAAPTFHGDNKPNVKLGQANVPSELLTALKA